MTRTTGAIVISLMLAAVSVAQNFGSLRKEAALAAEKGDFKEAISKSEKALQVSWKDKKISDVERLSLASENAAYYLFDEQVNKGDSLFKNLFNEFNQTNKPTAAEMSMNLNYGLALVFLSDYASAQRLLLRARELSANGNMLEEDRFNCLQALAVCYQYSYDFPKAQTFFREAEQVCKSLHDPKIEADLQSRMALLYVDMLDNQKALLCYEKAEKIYKQSKDTLHPQYPVFLLEYGAMLAETYNYDKALDLTFKAKNSDKNMYGELSQAYAADLNNLGFIYNRLNRFAETEHFYTQSLAIKKQLSHQRVDSYLNSLSNLISFYANIGRDEEAQELSLELEKSMERKDFTDTLKRAVFAHNLGIHHKNWGNYSKSHFYFKEALKYYSAVYGAGNSFEGQIYLDMGTTFFVENKWDDVTRCLKRAAEVMSKHPLEDNVNTIGALCNLAIILKETNNAEQGIKYVDKALDLVEKLKVTQQDVLEQAYLTKAQLAADLGRIQESMQYFNKYLDLKYASLEQNFSYMTEEEKLFFLDEFEKEIRNYYSVILNNIKEYPDLIKTLLDFRLKTKSLLLNNLSKIKEKIRNQKNPALEARFDAMCLKRETVAKLMNFNTDDYPQALSEAQRLKVEADQMEKEISLSLSTSLSFEKTTQWKDLQKNLAPGEAAIEIFQSYLIYDNNQGKGTNYTFIILKDKGDPITVSIDRPENWETQVLLAYRNSIANMKTDASLYARLWQLVADQVKDCNTLYVSPDGVYNQMNLNTLYHAQTGKYLIEEKEIHLLSSLRTIISLKNTVAKKPQSAVLVGNPRFDLDLSKITQSDKSTYASAKRGAFGFVLNELPGTKSEIHNIQNTLITSGLVTTVFTEEAATEKQLKKIVSPDILHIATHGFFLEDFKDEQLAGYSKLERDYYKNPMLRCGIFLSGSNNTYSLTADNSASIHEFEDGMLSAFEAMNLKLDNTQLVVLSACETGLGKVKNGEGVFGLQRAFKLAGAKSIIMSLWAVSDDATKDLMTGFYANWAKQGSLYQSFRNAQLDLKKTFPEPVYWGAFVVYDN